MPHDYVQVIDIERMVNGLDIDTDGGVSIDQADQAIALIEGEVNGMLSGIGISTPISVTASPKSWQVIKSLATWGIMALSLSTLHSLIDDTEGSREAAFWRRYDRGLKAIIDSGGSGLIDAETFQAQNERNGAPTISDQADNVDRYIGLRDLSKLRHYDNENKAARLLRGRVTRNFDGGI